MRTARERGRALRAGRSGRPTDRFPKLHDRLVERAGVRPGQDRSEGLLEASADERVLQVPFLAGPAGRDPQSVRFERDDGAAERDRRDGSGGVRADARKGLELADGGGEPTFPLPHELASRRVQVVGTGIVAGALPGLQDPADGGLREGVDRGERSHEPLEVRGRLRDARLLEEDLRDPDPVRVPVVAPRQRSTVETVPSEEGGRERGRERRHGRRSGTHGPRTRDGAET
jgi:hypothetical protein